MQLTIEKQFVTDEPIEKVWSFLNDPYKVVACVPGAKITDKIDEENYKGAISIKVGPITTDYTGEATIDLRDSKNFELRLTAKGNASMGMGNASVILVGKLRQLDDGKTEVKTTANTTIAGRVAQLGSRMVSAVSDKMFDEFVVNFERSIPAGSDKTAPAGKVKPISAFSLISSVTPLYVKVLVPVVLILILILFLSYFGVLPKII